jgi:subtilisin family serine protease
MPAKRRSTGRGKPTQPSSQWEPVFTSEADTVIPGELLLTLVPSAADSMTASVPVHPSGPVESGARSLGVDDLDTVLARLGAHDVTRLALPGPTGAAEADAATRGLEATEEQVLARSFRVRVDLGTDLADAVAKLEALDSVEAAEPNRYRETSVVPNDPSYGSEWGLAKINAPAAWDRTTGSASVVVGVIDTGIDLDHPDLVGNIVAGYDMVDLGTSPTAPAGFRFEGDFSGRDSVPEDEVGHGSHVAGTIAAMSNNALGVAGVTWQCKIMPVKALTRMVRISDGQVRGVGSSADIAAAVRYAADNGASVINMSLGSSGTTTVESSAIAYAISRGVVVVAAMGNDGTSNPSYPAAYPDVVSVGAIDSADHRASFSQTGPHIDVVAPGVGVLSTYLAAGYGTLSGTSMATPHVAGVAALIRSVKPSATVAEVTDILRTTARPLRDASGDPVPNDSYGWGCVDAAAAVNRAAPIITRLRTPVLPCLPPLTQRPICGPIRTPIQFCAPPRTMICPVVSPVCPPTITPVTTTPVTTTPITRTPVTPTIGRPGLGGGAGAAGAAGYDPYGYLGGAGQVPEEQGASEGQGGTYEEGYADGYAAALAQVQQELGSEQGAGGGETAGGGGNDEIGYQPGPFIRLRTPVLECIPITTMTPPRSPFWWRCPQPPRTVIEPQCYQITPTPWTITPTITTTFPPTGPTTPVQGGPGGFEGGLGGYGGYDPYGQSPFQG